MSRYIFERTKTIVSQQFLDSLPDGKRDIITEIALTENVSVDCNNNGLLCLEGSWEQLMNVHVLLTGWKVDEEEKRKNALLEQAMLPAPVLAKTKPRTMGQCIKQKYLNASRKRHVLAHNKKRESEVLGEPSVELDMPEKQENEVYVNITVSDGDLSHISTLFGSGQGITSLISEELLAPHNTILLRDSVKKTHSMQSEQVDSIVIPYDTIIDENNIQNLELKENISKPICALNDTVPPEEKKAKVKKKDYEKLAPFKFFCKQCSFKSKRESHFQRHLQIHKKVSDLFCCSKCDFKTLRLGHLRRHELTHNDTNLKCDKCRYQTYQLKFLIRHQRMKHCKQERKIENEKLLTCNRCNYSTTRQHLYQRHMQAHVGTKDSSGLLNDEQMFQCQQCKYKTARKEHYIRHVKNVHDNKRPYLCDHCGKAFKRADALKQHRLTHVEIDSSLDVLRCPACRKCFRTQAQLTQHLAVHSNERAFLCEICGASFKTRSVQRKHVLTIHKNPKAFSCAQCSRKFNTKFALLRHMKQHSLDKKRKSGGAAEEPAKESSNKVVLAMDPERTLQVLMSEPILIQEAPSAQVQDSQKAITVQVIGFMQ